MDTVMMEVQVYPSRFMMLSSLPAKSLPHARVC